MKEEHKEWLFRSFNKNFPDYTDSDNIQNIFYKPEDIKKWLEKWLIEYERKIKEETLDM